MEMMDWAVFIIAILNVLWNMAEAKERPVSAVLFGALWGALATMAVLGVNITESLF